MSARNAPCARCGSSHSSSVRGSATSRREGATAGSASQAPCAACSSPAIRPCVPRAPRIVTRSQADILATLLANRAGYVPACTASAQSADASAALLAVVARQLEIQGDGLNAMPLRLQLEFLDALGGGLLPAKPARAPLVFKLLDKATADAAVPAATRAAAVLPPPSPSLDPAATIESAAKPEFFTEQEITAMRGRLAAVYSIDPRSDVYADHSAAVTSGFRLFTDMAPVPHRLYLAHGELYRLGGTAQIVLTFDFATAGLNSAGVATRQRPLLIDWEYLSADGWLPLKLQSDETARFTRDGSLVLAKSCGPDAKQDIIFGHESCWIRGTIASRVPSARVVRAPAAGSLAVVVEHAIELLPGDVVTIDGVSRATIVSIADKTVRLDRLPSQVAAGEFLMLADALPPLRPDGADEEGVLPQVDTIRTRVGFEKSDLALDGAYLDGFTIDTSKDFYPFGTQPQRFASFYVACKEAFSRTGARIELAFTFVALGGTTAAPSLVAEYFNGLRWTALGSGDDYVDETDSFSAPPASPPSPAPALARKVKFVVPDAWVETEVEGDKNFWLRFRLASGDYGQPVAVSVAPDANDPTKYIVNSSPSTLVPPIVAELRAAYTVLSNPVPLDFCVTENDFAFTEHSENARWPRGSFVPFVPVTDRVPALHFGFSAKPPPALVSVLVAVDAAAQDSPLQPLVWDYWGTRGWTELSVRDPTNGLRQTGLIQFVGAPDALPRDGVGGSSTAYVRGSRQDCPASTIALRCAACGSTPYGRCKEAASRTRSARAAAIRTKRTPCLPRVPRCGRPAIPSPRGIALTSSGRSIALSPVSPSWPTRSCSSASGSAGATTGRPRSAACQTRTWNSRQTPKIIRSRPRYGCAGMRGRIFSIPTRASVTMSLSVRAVFSASRAATASSHPPVGRSSSTTSRVVASWATLRPAR